MTRKPTQADPGPRPTREPAADAHLGAQSAVDQTLAIAHEGDTLIVRVGGPIEAQRARIAYWREIVAIARARRCRKLLVIDRKKGQPATLMALAELALLVSADARHFDRVAVVEPDPTFLSTVERGELLGRAVGINVRVFAERKAAERWLRYGAPGE